MLVKLCPARPQKALEERISLKQAVLPPPGWIKSSLQRKNTASSKKPKSKIAALDGVRAIAALLIVVLHISDLVGVPWSTNGNPVATAFAFFGRMGVVLFFVLSGFLLFMPYAKALLFQEEWPSIRKFYLRRIFRIWPGYYLCLFILVVFFSRRYLLPENRLSLTLFATFLMDSSTQTWQKLNGPFWTLATEWQFYMVLPLISLGFAWVVRRFTSTLQQRLKVTLLCCCGVLVWALAIRAAGLYYTNTPQWNPPLPRGILNFISFLIFGVQGKYLEIFALGMMASTLYIFTQDPTYGQLLKSRLQNWSNRLWMFGWIFILFIALWQVQATKARDGIPYFHALDFFQPLQSYFHWIGEPIIGFGFAACIVAILFGSPQLRWFFELRFLRWIGMISFSLYMWHQFLLGHFYSMLPRIGFIHGSFMKIVILWIFVVVVVLPFCYLLYKLVEEPGMRLGQRITSKKFQPVHFQEWKTFFSPRALLARIHRS